ncbi:hypothetical protein B0T36_14565 [Nocardia donostiensis]|nr:hypothetical protein B0T36_14565 [Nocardia donostiensis]
MDVMRSPVAAIACQRLGGIRHTIHTASSELSRFGHDFAHNLRESAHSYALSDHDMHRIFEERIVPEQLDVPGRSTGASGQLRLIVELGQPGAGKSTAIDTVAASFRDRGGAVPLIADNYMPYHPLFAELRARDDFTAGDHLYPIAERWLDMAIDYIIASRKHAILEEGAGNPRRAARVIQRFQQNNYAAAVEVLAVPRAESGASVLTRFLHERLRDGTGRYVPTIAQDICFTGSADLLRLLESPDPPVAIDELRVRSRSEVLFENYRDTPSGWSRPPEGWDALQEERGRALTPDEKHAHSERMQEFHEALTQAYARHPEQAADWHRLSLEMDRMAALARS